VRDEVLGQSIRAEVVIKPGKEFLEKKLKAHCALHLEPYKIPGSIVLVPAIPKTAAGKTRREPL
jgi:acyl-CoA synthetase (AMP-forming)/AMP-acid ligase II